MEERYEIRTMRREELGLAIEWAALEGWNPGLHDAAAFYAADPDGFLIGLLDGEPIASISAVVYDEAFAFLGFYIVKPEFRGRGFGLQIWGRAMDRAGARTVGLDGVVAQQANYARSGFNLAYRNVRYEGTSTAAAPADAAADGIVDLTDMPLDDVLAYDRRFFPSRREPFVRAWLAMPESTALGLAREGRLVGMGVMRRCRSGFKLGPLFADDEEAAESLFSALTNRADAGSAISLDVPESNPRAVEMALRHGMTPVSETARMYSGPPPQLPLDGIYGVTTVELG